MKKALSGLLVACVLGYGASSFAAADEERRDWIQNDALAAPRIASLKSGYADFGIQGDALSFGTLSVPFPHELPSARGAILHPILPTYTHNNGQSEFGKGWDVALRIHRYSERGEVSCGANTFSSPWGKLVASHDGKTFYPQGLAIDLRIVRDAEGFQAFHPDGRVFRFGYENVFGSKESAFAWYLSEVTDKEGHKTSFTYAKNQFQRPMLVAVQYGGKRIRQYQVELSYVALQKPILSYEGCNLESTISQRISSISIKHWDGSKFVKQKTQQLTHTYIDDGASFYLSKIDTELYSGELLPPIQFSYDGYRSFLEQPSLKVADSIYQAFGGLRNNKLYSTTLAIADFNQDGILDFERADNLQTFLQTEAGEARREAAYWSEKRDSRCSPAGNLSEAVRQFALRRLLFRPAGADDALSQLVLTNKRHLNGTLSHIVICSLEGQVTYEKEIFTELDLGYFFNGKTHLVDLNADLRPDLVALKNGRFVYFLNESTNGKTQFANAKVKKLPFDARRHKKFKNVHFVDLNTDGFVDLVAEGERGLSVWYGKGGQEFAENEQFFFMQTELATWTALDDSELTFVDVNRDGFVDIVRNFRNQPLIYLHQGNRFFYAPSETLRAHPFKHGYARLINLTATGDDQLTMRGGLWDGLVAYNLNGPSTGLLSRIDNGQGVALEFQYQWTKAKEGTPRRFIVPKSIRVTVPGLGIKTTQYEFSDAKINPLNMQLLGFESVRVSGDQTTTQMSFWVAPQFTPKIQKVQKTDVRLPEIAQVETYYWQDFVLDGVLGQRNDVTQTSYLSDGQEYQKQSVSFSDYDRLCAKKTVNSNANAILTTVVDYAEIPAWLGHHPCLATNQTSWGTHVGHPEDDFVLSQYLILNDVGLPSQLGLIGKEGEHLQTELRYDSFHNLQSVYDIDSGHSLFATDPTFEIVQSVQRASGKATWLKGYDALADGIAALLVVRGDQNVWEQNFAYDAAGRLERIWDGLTQSSEQAPLSRYGYQFGNATFPALVNEHRKVAPGTYAHHADFYLADGTKVLEGQQSADGYKYGKLLRADAATAIQQEVSTFGTTVKPNELSYAALGGMAQVLSEVMSSPIWGALTRSAVVDANHQNKRVNHMEFSERGREIRSVENGEFVTRLGFDSSNAPAYYIDELGDRYEYRRDALGRLRSVQLPDGSKHEVQYDDLGRIQSHVRSGIGKALYAYDGKLSRLKKKAYYGDQGHLLRRVELNYDSAARVVSKTYQSGTEEERYEFDYDAELVAQVRHKGFTKFFQHAPDEKLLQVTLLEKQGTSISIYVGHDPYRRLSEQSLVVQRSNGSGLSYAKTFGYDGAGQLSFVAIGNQQFELSRGRTGKIETIGLPGGKVLTVVYDALTGNRIQTSLSEASGENIATCAWHFNDRGLVEGITHGWMGQTQYSSYQHAADKSLITPAGSKEGHHKNFVLGALGRLKSFRLKDSVVDYTYDENMHRIAKYRDGVLEFLRLQDAVATLEHVYEKLNIEGIDVGILVDGVFIPALFDQVGTLVSFGSEYSLALPYGERETVHPIHAFFDYAGHGRDSDTGLISMGARDYDPSTHRFISPDWFVFENPGHCIKSPKECDLHSYARGNPLLYHDPNGQWVDTAADVIFLTSDIYELQQDPSIWNGVALGADVVGAILPGVTGLGKGVKAIEKGIEVAKGWDKVQDTRKVANQVRKEWQITNPTKVMNHPKFKNFYKNANDGGNWWTKDLAGHGGATWKVYEETPRGLEWIKDADKYGTYMNKHKSEVGMLIPWKELGAVK